jgi:NDP-sugar pyrophosphorylase family protein
VTLPIQLVIPAAGAGTRFREAGIFVPKPLIEIGGYPMILWVISNFDLSAEDSVVIISQKVDGLPVSLQEYLKRLDCKVSFVEINGLTSGPASTVQLAIPNLDPHLPVIVANSDQYVSGDLSEFMTAVRRNVYAGTILTMNATGDKWSYVGRNSNGEISQIVEKKEISAEATVGIYAWANLEILKNAIDYLKSNNLMVNNEFYIAPSYNHLIEKNLSLGCVSVGPHGARVHGLGTPYDLNEFMKHTSYNDFCVKISNTVSGSRSKK